MTCSPLTRQQRFPLKVHSRPGHLIYWHWDGVGRTAAVGLGGGRRPRRPPQTLSDRCLSSAGETAFGLEAPRSAARGGPSAGRFRRGKPARGLAAKRFFYPGPVGLDPTLNGRFIPLDGTALRLLRAPAQSVQQAADMVDMITDTKRLVDDLADTRTSPEICGIPRCPGAAKQGRFKRFLGSLIQPGRPTRRRLGPNSRDPLLQEGRFPASYAAPPRTNALSDFHRLISLRKKPDSAQTTLFKSPWTAGWSHMFPPA